MFAERGIAKKPQLTVLHGKQHFPPEILIAFIHFILVICSLALKGTMLMSEGTRV